MAQRQKREELGVKPGDQIVVKGTVSFARLDKLVEGDALERENQRRSSLGMIATKPFRSITIENPEIVKGQGTPLATFHGQTVYTNKDGKKAMSLESKSLFPPTYGHIQNGKIVQIADPEKNPNTGQEVYLMISAFQSKGYSNLGSTFDSIVYPEGNIDFYQGGGGNLTGFGEALGLEVEHNPQGQDQNAGGNQSQNAPQGDFSGNAGAFGGDNQNQQDPFGGFQGQDQNQNQGQFGMQDADAQNSAFGGQNSGQGIDNPFGGGPGTNSPYA